MPFFGRIGYTDGMAEREKRSTLGGPKAEKFHKIGIWTAFFSALPALYISLQEIGAASEAKRKTEERVQDVSEESYRRDDRTWRYTRHVLDRHEDDLEACFNRMEDMAELVDALYAVVNELATRNGRRTSVTMPTRHFPAPLLPSYKQPRPSGELDLPSDLDTMQTAAEGL